MNENYLGNPNLKRSNVNINYTKEQLEEYIKCAKDPVYFIEEYIQIVNVDKGLVPFKLYNFQDEMVNAFQKERFVINKLPRQSGKSTTVTAYMLCLILLFLTFFNKEFSLKAILKLSTSRFNISVVIKVESNSSITFLSRFFLI